MSGKYREFYQQLFKPIAERLGPLDAATSMAIIGFDCGGPLSLCTVGYRREEFVTYVSCELAVVEGQKTGDTGPFEVMMVCDSEEWARDILTRAGRMSFNTVLEHGHTIDIGPVVDDGCPVQGLVVEEFARVSIGGRTYGILCFHGLTRPELEYGMKFRGDPLLNHLKQAGVYPRTSVHRRESIALPG